MKLKEMYDAYKLKTLRLSQLLVKGEEMTEEEMTEAGTLNTEIDALEPKIQAAKRLEAVHKGLAARIESVNGLDFGTPPITPPVGGAKNQDNPNEDPEDDESGSVFANQTVSKSTQYRVALKSGKVPAYAATAKVKNLPNGDVAFRMGMFFLASIFADPGAKKWCKLNGIEVKFMRETNNTAGGWLVPEEFDTMLIILREQYGVFRKYSYVSTMMSDTKSIPRRKTGLTPYPIGEGVTITESEASWDRVLLVARKWGVLAKYSNELNEDAIINMGDDLAGEIAYAFSKTEDDCGFNGDGTSTYHKIIGVRQRFKLLDANRANIAGLAIAASGSWSTGITLANFNSVVGLLPEYARVRSTPTWFCSQTFFNTVMERLMLASGGVTAAEVAAGRREKTFMGWPVQITQIMPAAYAADDIPVIFGALDLATTFGDRRGMTIAMSEHLNFAEDEIAIRGTERFDINCHDVGNSTAGGTAAIPGPVVALLTT